MFDLDISSFDGKYPSRMSLSQDSVKKIEGKYGISIQASDVTLIGDTPLIIACVKNVGCRVIAIATGNYKESSLAELEPEYLFKHLIDAREVMCLRS